MAEYPPVPHLDAFAGRDVVFCHWCENEWFQDERGLQCPRCRSEATEIVTPDNDPRNIHDHPSPTGFGGSGFPGFHHSHDDDSDPEEADIEEHVRQGPDGFFMRRTVYRSPSQPQEGDPSRPGERSPVDPNDGDAILRRFTDMLMHDFRVGAAGRSGPETLFPPDDAGDYMFGGRAPHVHRTTFRGPGFSGGTTTFTIATGPITRSPGSPSNAPPGMDFDTYDRPRDGQRRLPAVTLITLGTSTNNRPRVFGNIMGGGNVPPPDANRAGAPPLPGFAASLHEILASLMNPAHAVHGDAVYSQEALDRIITSLMEANPQSNAAPPATQAAIERLEKKKLDAQMMGSDDKAECTICIDEIHLGDEVTVLPCKHWFHGDCVVLWLKEHNTCPICRHPVEGGENNNANPNTARSQPQQPHQPFPPPPFASASGPWAPPPSSPPMDSFTNYRRRERPTRSPSENEDRLNAIRNAAGAPPASWRSTPPRPRHGSLSPPSPRGDGRSATSSRTRLRSPSASDRDRERERERYPHRYESSSQRNSSGDDSGSGGHSGGGHNPLSWLRDQFSRNSGSGSSSGRRRS